MYVCMYVASKPSFPNIDGHDNWTKKNITKLATATATATAMATAMH